MELPAWKQRLNGIRLDGLADVFRSAKPVIGMVHLWPLPGSPGYTGYGMGAILDNALRDAEALLAGGVDGLIIENMWDLPYRAGRGTPPESMTAHAVAARAVAELSPVPVGINVVHNGGVIALAIAVAAGASFMRVCIHAGARLWDTGEFDQGVAGDLLRKRKELHAEHIKLFADVDKKHSVPFPGIDLATHIEWTEFYLADALIVTGRMTGDAPLLDEVQRAKELATRPVLLGSGTTADNIAAFLQVADGVIVGSWLKRDGIAENPVDVDRVRRFMDAARS